MDVREKLVELLMQVEDNMCDDCGREPVGCAVVAIADHLIVNGATVGKPLAQYLHPIDNYEGLKGKYLVFKADTGEQVGDCFVLRPAKDTAAVEALRAYAHSTDNKTLSNDIYNWVGNGKTVEQWIPVTERLPEKSDWVLALTYNNKIHTLPFSVENRAFNSFDGMLPNNAIECSHWMPLPEPPKGE